MKNKWFILFIIIFIVLGGAFQFVPCEFFKSFGASMISCVMVSFVWQYYISETDNKKIEGKIKKYFEDVDKRINNGNLRLSEFNAVGLQNVYKDRAYLTNNIEDLILSANHSIKIMGESLNSFLDRPHFERKLEEALSKKINIDILLLSLNSDSIEERYRELELKKEESIGIHKKALRTYYKYDQRYSNFNLRLFQHHPKLILLIIDDKSIYVQHYSYGMKGYEAPLYFYKDGRSDIEKFYCDIFDNVWNDNDTKEAKYEEQNFKN